MLPLWRREQGGLACCCCNPAAVTIKDSSPVHQIGKEAGQPGALLRLHLKQKTTVQASPDSPLRPRMAKCSAVISVYVVTEGRESE